mmetsp:Transcript_49420/g.91161  ORF Transcript_49420/g.91161 Transcript_49420/m.91161 type:complete len:813 (+) Transcript_49420:96-2534(+)
MPAQSKMIKGAKASALGLGALALASSSATGFVQVPATRGARMDAVAGATRHLEQTETAAATAPSAAAGFSSLKMPAACAAGAVSLMAAGSRKRAPKSKLTLTARQGVEQSSSSPKDEAVALASNIVKNPGSIDLQAIFHVRDCAFRALHSDFAMKHEGARRAFAEVVDSAASMVGPSVGLGEQQRWVANALASMLLAFSVQLQPASALDQVTYSDFVAQVEKGNVEMVRVQPDMLSAQFTSKDGQRREVNLIPNAAVEDALFDKLAQSKVDVVMQTTQMGGGGPLEFLSRFAGPLAWLIAALLLLFGGTGGAGAGGPLGGNNPFQMTKSPARVIKEGDVKTKFDDVAGCDGAKQELMEVVDFLKNSERYSSLGAKIPKGALLAGPPGTGKTLLAKAVAGEAGVPFFSVSASEFVEVFAGAGAGRVRDLFAEAKKAAPCIIFIDEIDAVGRQRSAGFGQGNDEREQTVNQLLTEMDGFDVNNGVVVVAATNRADTLDRALIRPGRFDRQIQVEPPDVDGRTAILKVHAKTKSLAPGVDLAAIARQTPGLAGADLANLLNEAAIVAARQNKAEVEQDDIADALERISIGLEKKDGVMSEKKKKLVAYHEAGHAILGALVNDYDVVTKISIVPRGPAGGVTIFMPSEDRLNSGLYSKEFLENRMCVALGGRIAEELINGADNVTTGASNDFQQCTQVAQAMVTQLGMSPLVGQRCLGGGQQQPFMGRDMMGQGAPPISQSLREQIDGEVKRIVNKQYVRGKELLESNRYLLDKLADKLCEQEKVNGDELMKMINEVAMEDKLVAAPLLAERKDGN